MSVRKDKVQLDIEINGKKAGHTYGELSKHVRDLNREIRKMEPGTDEFIKKSKELQKVRARMKEIKDQIYGIDRSLVGTIKHMFSMQNVMRGLSQILPSIGIAGILYKTQQAFQSLLNTTRDYGKALSSLQSLTGATAEDIAFYDEKAKELGVSLKKSALEIVDAFKIVGSQRPELLKNRDALAEVTEQAIILSQAGEIDLKRAVDAVTGSLNQWQLQTSDTARVINALAAGSKEGAADIPSLADAIDKSGTAAAGFNVSLEESIGLLETFGEFNLKGAEAGTKLRNVLSIIQSAKALPPEALERLEQYGVNLDIATDKNRSLEERLREFAKIADDATAITKVFGRENQVAGSIALQNVDKFVAYTEAVTGTAVAYEQAETNLDNLDGDMQEFSATLEALTVRASGLANNALRAVVQTGTQLLLVVQEIPTFLRENKSEIIALTSAIIAWNSAQIASAANALRMRAATLLSAAAARAATIQFNALRVVMMSNPYVLAIAGLTALGATLYTVFKRINDTKEAYEDLTDEAQKQADSYKNQRTEAKALFDILRELNGRLNELEEGTEAYNAVAEEKRRVIDRINKQYGTYLPQLLTEKSSIDDIRIAQEAANKALLKKQLILAFQDRIKQALDDEIERRERIQEIERSRAATRTIESDPRYATAAALRQQELDLVQGVQEAGIKSAQQARATITDNFKAIFEDVGIAWSEVLDEINQTAQEIPTSAAPPTPPPPSPPSPEKETAKSTGDDIYKAYLTELQLFYDRYNLILEKQLIDEKITQEEYDEQILQNKLAFLDYKIDLIKEYGTEETEQVREVENERLAVINETLQREKDLREDPDRALSGIRDEQEDRELALKQKFANQLIAEQQYQEQLAQMRLQFYNDQLRRLEEAGLQETEAYKKILHDKLDAEIEFQNTTTENAKRTEDIKQQIQQASFDLSSELITTSIELLGKDEEARKDHAATIKAFESARVFINMLAEISNYWKTYSAVPGGQVLAGLLSAAAFARGVGAITKINAEEFALGGLAIPKFSSRQGRVIGMPNIPTRPSGDNMLAYLKIGETVLNEEQVKLLGGPAVMKQIGVPGYATGGRAQPTSVDTTPKIIDMPNTRQSAADQKAMLEKMDTMITTFQNFNTELHAKIVYSEFEKIRDEIDDLRQRTAL